MQKGTTESSSILEHVKELDAQLDLAAKEFSPDAGPNVEPGSTPETAPDTPAAQEAAELGHPVEQHEDVVEKAFEQYKQVDDEHPEESPYVIKKATTKRDEEDVQAATKSPDQIKVEEILAEGLAELYQAMSPADQEAFRLKGEETAEKIASLMDRVKLSAKKALDLITKWLRLIPGVDQYFLEQEAKIKTEEVMRYARKRNSLPR